MEYQNDREMLLLPTQWLFQRKIRRSIKLKWLVISYISLVVLGAIVLLSYGHHEDQGVLTRRWGGLAERPLNNKCYRQERTAILLSIFLGPLGIDQWYAHHWVLATFKLITVAGGGVWWITDTVLWTVGGVYGTPGCPGGSDISWQY